MPTIKYPVEADASNFKRGMAEAKDALKGATGAMEEWTKSQQRAAMKMESMHEEALKMNSAFKSASDDTARAAANLRAFDSALGGPISKTKGLSSALDLADVGMKNLKTTSVGFTAVSAGVVGAALAIGGAIGSWLDSIPAVRREVDGLRDSLLSFNDTQLGNALTGGLLGRGLRAFGIKNADERRASEMPDFDQKAIAAQRAAFDEKAIERQRAAGASLKELDKIYGDRLPASIKKLVDAEKRAADARKKHAAEAKAAAKELAEQNERLAAEMFKAGTLHGGMGGLGGAFSFGARAFQKADLFGVEGGPMPIQEMKVGKNLGGILGVFGLAEIPAQKIVQKTKEWHQEVLGVANILAQIGGPVGGFMSSILAGVSSIGVAMKGWKDAGGGLSGVLSKVGLVGGVVGAGFGIANTIGNVFLGGQREHKQVNDMRDEFLKLQGGWEKLHGQLAAAGNAGLMNKIFDAKTIGAFNDAVSQAQRLLGLQDQAMSERLAAAKEFGLVSQAQIEQDGIALLRKRELLLTEFSQGEVNKAMAEKVNEYVQATVAAGRLVPENFKPILEQMAAMGLLTDSAGNAVDTLAEAGVDSFGEMTDASKELVKSIKELVDVLRAAAGLGPVTVPGGGGGGLPPGPRGEREGVQRFDSGGWQPPGPHVSALVGGPSGEFMTPGDAVPRLAELISSHIGAGGSTTVVVPVYIGSTKLGEAVAEAVRGNDGGAQAEIDRRVRDVLAMRASGG